MNETEKTTALTVRWLDPAQVQAQWQSESVRLVVRINGGEEIKNTQATLAFPVTSPNGYVEFSDAKGDSIGILKSLANVAPESLAAIRAALAARYMIPFVVQLVEMKEASPFVLRWRVETNMGAATFFTESTRESVRYLTHDRIRITDLAGNQFDIPSISGLDASSRDILSAFL